jgi:uncharacterized protein involved in response to NO
MKADSSGHSPDPQPSSTGEPRLSRNARLRAHLLDPVPDLRPPRRSITLGDLHREPFRVFFPAAVLAGVLGVSMWPLHFGGWIEAWPAMSHARLMAHGFFGGFITGFLGTALPRLLSARPLSLPETSSLFALFAASMTAHFSGWIPVGDALFLGFLGVLAVVMGRRFLQRQDMPPPAFVLVVMAFASVAAGTVIALLAEWIDTSFYWLTLRPLLAYQGFVLLPILGVGTFVLPRFLGLPVTGAYPDSRTPPPGWWREAGLAFAVGVVLLGTFFLEAAGWYRVAYAARFMIAGGWLFTRVRLRPDLAWKTGAVLMIVTGMVLLPAGYLVLALFPVWRTALLHIVLGGGFGFITLGVAMRVMYGHSGIRDRLRHHTGWWITAGVLMLLGLASRISADFIPRLLVSHYIYGALFWVAGMLLWSAWVLPRALVPDPEE